MPGGSTSDSRQVVSRHRPGWGERSFLARIELPVLHELLDTGTVTRFRPKQPLMSEGELSATVCLLLSSYVKVTARRDNGGDTLLAVRCGGDLVGELAAVDGRPRSATVVACGREPVDAVCLESDAFLSVLSRWPRALVTLTESVSSKLRTSTRRRVERTGCAAEVRLARILVEMAEDHGTPGHSPGQGHSRSVVIGVDISQVEWGTLMSATESTAQRAMGKLRAKGLVDTRYRRATIRDLAALRDFAG